MFKKRKFSKKAIPFIIVSILSTIYTILDTIGVVSLFSTETKLNIVITLLLILISYILSRNNSIDIIKELLTDDKIKTMEVLLKDLDYELKDIFQDDIDKNFRFYKNAIHNKTICIENKHDFSKYYRFSLKRYPNAYVFATSLPSKSYFWSNNVRLNSVEKATKEFTSNFENKGTFSRVFFLDDENDIYIKSVKETLDFQKNEMGVKVFTILISEVPEKYRNYFYVVFDQKNSNFAWSAEANPKGEVSNFNFTVNPNIIDEYKKNYNKLKQAPSWKEY